MTAPSRDRSERVGRPDRSTITSLVALAVAVYVPLLLTAPGRVAADTDAALLIGPGRLLRRAVSMWDPHVAMGTVPREQIGHLWPAGPYFWLTDQAGLPDWVSQRLWVGSILFAAGAGVLFLARTWRWRPAPAAAAAFVFTFSPYVITLATHDSIALLAFAGLPWMLALTIRALRSPGLRHPALFALVVATVGSTDRSALVLVGVAPVAWIIYSIRRYPEVTRASATWTTAKLGATTLAVNLWWIGGLSVQATNGLRAKPYLESAEVVASTSTAPEVLRGLGSWFFYERDRLGPLVEPSVDYTQQLWLIALTYGITVIGLLGLGVARWRNRSFAIWMLVIGAILAVGAHPWDQPSPIGRLFKAITGDDVPLALRDSTGAVPLIALALAVGVAALVGAAHEESHRRGFGTMALAIVVAIAALPPLWLGGFVPTDLARPNDIPDHWLDAAAHLDARDDGTRVLEIPGIDQAAYRWGYTGDSVLAALLDRPSVARERTPSGSPASANLLDALDRRLQDQTLDPDALAVIARIMNVGDVVTRNDLQYERYDVRRPRSLWDFVSHAGGLSAPTTFGTATVDRPVADAPMIDEEHLVRDSNLPDPPPVGLFPVTDAIPIVHTHGAERVVYLSGDGTGIIDAAAAGLIDGSELLRYSADITADPEFVRTGLVDERALIVTDSNRSRAEHWASVRHTQGFTEQVDGGLLRSDATDNRLPVFEDRLGIHAFAEHVGIAARATAYGDPAVPSPHERPVNAVDGDPTTVWRVAAGADPRGERIELLSDSAVESDQIRFVQARSDVGHWITEIELRFDGGDPVRVALDASSHRQPGQEVRLDQRAFESLSIEILDDNADGDVERDDPAGVGFAEIDLGLPPTHEYIRMPQDLLDAGGFRTLRYPLALVQTRERSTSTDVSQTDEELSLARVVELPSARTFRLTGAARLSAEAPTSVLDALTGRAQSAETPTVTATSTISGGLGHLPSNVLDGDPSTRWTSAFDAATGQTLTIESASPKPVGPITLTIVDDVDHSVPTVVEIEVDGRPVSTTVVPPGPAGVRDVLLDVPIATIGTVVSVSFPDVDVRTTIDRDRDSGATRALPVAVTSLAFDGWTVGPQGPVDSGCRDDLVLVDGIGLPVRITGDLDALDRGGAFDVRTCDDSTVTLSGGDRRFDSTDGRDSGFDIDQLVWCSSAGGAACDGDRTILPTDERSTPVVEVIDDDDATVRVQVTGASPGTPFWLVLGQSFEPGWEIVDATHESAPTQLVDGFANGFLVTPDAGRFEVTMRFVPQNRVEIGLLLSVVGIVVALGLAIGSPTSTRPVPIPLQEPLRRIRALTWEGGLPTRRDAMAVALAAGVGAALVTAPLVGVAIGILAGVATRREGWRGAFTALPAALLGLCALYLLAYQLQNEVGPGLRWPGDTGRLHTVGIVAVVLLVVDLVIDRAWARRSDFR